MNGAAPPISVLLPVRDAEPFLAEALDSVQAQTFADFEVWLVDDGSRDGSVELARERAAEDSRLQIVCQPALGIAMALERARARSRGRYLARMDADDITDTRRFELQHALLEADPALVACGCSVEYFPRAEVRGGARRYQDWLNGLKTHTLIERDLFVECPLAHPTVMLRADAVEAMGGYRNRGWPEDYDLLLRLWRAGGRFGHAEGARHRWRERPRRASRTLAAYAPAAFRRCKVHHLSRTLLRGKDGVVVWGAGPTGKAFARTLLEREIPLRAFIDLDPRKIGQEIHGAPVLPPGEANRCRGALCVGAVSGEAARAEIRAALARLGWREMVDFVAVA